MTNFKLWDEATPRDPNHKDRFATINGIKFCALPYSPYYARQEDRCATVISMHRSGAQKWMVNRYNCLSNGDAKHAESSTWIEPEDAFKWAASWLNGEK